MNFFVLIFSLILSAQLFAEEKITFQVKDPYPVCIQELKDIEPTLPDSFFAQKKLAQVPIKNQTTPCADLFSEESLSNGFNAIKTFYLDSLPKVEQEIFAKNFIEKGNFKERLKNLNDVLLKCQDRTEKLHVLASKAAGGIYDFDSKDITKFVPPGYEIRNVDTDFFEFPNTDVKGYLVYPKKPNTDHNPPIISFAGTRSLKSTASDLTYGASQVNNIKVTFNQWVARLEREGIKEMVLTGHSLGGGLAQTLAALIPEPSEIKTHVVTFNGFGGKDAIKAYNKIFGGVDQNKNYETFQPTRDAVGYRLEGDVVSLLGERFGETRTIPTVISKIRVVSNHRMPFIDDRIKDNPHALAEAKKEDVSPFIRPISFIVQTASIVTSAWNSVTDSFEEVFEKECKEEWSGKSNHSETCSSPNGDPTTCIKEGKLLSAKDTTLSEAMEKFKTGCDMCSGESCVEYAVLNKKVGYESRTLSIAKRACDLGDGSSCIEAGTIIVKKEKIPLNLEKYVALGCAYSAPYLCKSLKNREFAQKYLQLKNTICNEIKSITSCEMLFLSSSYSTETSEERIKRIGELLPKLDNFQNFKTETHAGSNMLHLAVANKDVVLSKYLIGMGVSTDAKDEFKQTPLMIAIDTRNQELIKLFLKKKVNYSNVNNFGESALSLAAKTNDPAILNLVMSAGGNLDMKNNQGETALFTTIQFNDTAKTSALLLEKGADPNIANENGVTPLMQAVMNGDENLVRLLIEKKAKLNAKTQNGNTVLTYAAVSGKMRILKLILNSYDEDPDPAELDKMFLKASFSNNIEMLTYLENRFHKTYDFNTPFGKDLLNNAAGSGNVAILEHFKQKGAKFDFQDSDGISPIMQATQHGDKEAIKFLLKENVNVNLKDHWGDTALINYLKRENDPEITKALIEQTTDIEFTNKQGFSPLYLAASNQSPAILQLLIDKGALVNPKNLKDGKTPLMTAAAAGSLENVKFLVEHNADVNSMTVGGNSPLSAAVYAGELDKVEYLISQGATITPDILKDAGPKIMPYLRLKQIENKSDQYVSLDLSQRK